MATVKQLYDLLDRKAPFRTQMDFDNAGFLVGRGDRTVTRVLVALDITPEVIAEAAEKGCQLILAHHPVIWGKLGQVTDESATGRKVLALIEKGIAAICAHTNLDAAEGGVNTALAQRLGLENPVPLETDGVDEARPPPTASAGWAACLAAPCPWRTLPGRPRRTWAWPASGPWTPGVRSIGWRWGAAPAAPCCPR